MRAPSKAETFIRTSPPYLVDPFLDGDRFSFACGSHE